jgi:hypothetical protein
MLCSSKNFKNRSENLFSSCITRIISSRPILSALHAVTADAVAKPKAIGVRD